MSAIVVRTVMAAVIVLPLVTIATRPATVAAQSAKPSPQPPTLGIGRPATPAEIAAIDIDIGPDGAGLPPGSGTPAQGATIYAARCAACHGQSGREGPNDVLVGRLDSKEFPFSRDPKLPRAIGNFWPYATTLFDYVRRAMPPAAPGSLKDDEVYAVVAHLLSLNELIPGDAVMDATTLPKVRMPARDRFVPDQRGVPKTKPRSIVGVIP